MKNSKKEKTFHELLKEDDIKILLENHEEINDKYELKQGMLIRYYKIINENDKIIKHFRIGGTIIKIDLDNNYIILSNGKVNWSVQLNDTIIYKKLTIEEVKNYYENELENKDIQLNKYKKYIINLKNKYKLILDENELLKKINFNK